MTGAAKRRPIGDQRKSAGEQRNYKNSGELHDASIAPAAHASRPTAVVPSRAVNPPGQHARSPGRPPARRPRPPVRR